MPDVAYEVELIQMPAEWLSKGSWSKTEFGYTWQGPCVKCGHEISKEILESAIVAFRESPEESLAHHMACNCQAEHGDGHEGCGRWWGIALEPAG